MHRRAWPGRREEAIAALLPRPRTPPGAPGRRQGASELVWATTSGRPLEVAAPEVAAPEVPAAEVAAPEVAAAVVPAAAPVSPPGIGAPARARVQRLLEQRAGEQAG